ncbi:MAG: hypothetical protein IJ532_05020 [Alphaproteobacteria bacterium]|nr:hypothetical protein [Alphaproteobacteria bacterium]
MPKLGLKCFLGSFILSLVAVFSVTKAYFVLSLNENGPTEEYIENLPAQNIELFAANEENDPLYDKFKSLEQHNELPYNDEDKLISNQSVKSGSSDTVLYRPETTDYTELDEKSAEVKVSDNDDLRIEDASILDIADAENSSVLEVAETKEESEELQIADASEAPVFRIPLVHHYKTENGTVVFSDSADENQIAMASSGVSTDNLGADTYAAVTEPLVNNDGYIGKSEFSAGLSSSDEGYTNPWEVAETSNKKSEENSANVYAAKHQDNIISPDQEVIEQPTEEYRMQKNLVIPIPENIANERNLTPQFSSSEENLKLERELRAKHTLPALDDDKYFDNSSSTKSNNDNDDDFQDFEEDDDVDADEETSKSLSDSIAEWFSGSKKKTGNDNITAPKTQSKNNNKKSQKSEGSIFNKLLGIGGSNDDNITPSELKLSFQPNRAEISGQTLEWLHAFADNSVKNEDVFIEIRIDKTAPYALQEKRLKLLYKILANNGVDYHKINIIFTDREPNSFIIRNVRYASEDDKIKAMKRADNPWY